MASPKPPYGALGAQWKISGARLCGRTNIAGRARDRSMHDRRTPSNLLDGQRWASWGPPVDGRADLNRSSLCVGLVARLTGLGEEQVREILGHDRCRYLLLKQLSRTKHAAVYLAVDRNLAREVVVKIHRDARQVARMQAIKESQAMARLSKHPNIVQIYDLGEHIYESDDGERSIWLYSVLERCDCNLFEWCAAKPRRWDEIAVRVIQVAHALACLHRAGLTHRDIKPTNVLILDGVAKLADFGSVATPGPKLELVGTVGYISPDAAVYGPSFASDLFALAVTLWVCLFGDLPYTVPSGPNVTRDVAANAVIQKCIDRALDWPQTVSPDLPGSVRDLLVRALDPDSERRPSLDEFIWVLQTALDRFSKRRQVWRRATAVTVGVLVAAGVGFSIGAITNRGAGSLLDAAIGALDHPLVRAEAAAWRGHVDTAMGALYRMDIAELSTQDSVRAGEGAERIATILAQRGHGADAIRAWFFVVQFYERAGRMQQAEHARHTREKLLSPGSSQSK
jgi:hypothetical protein